MLVNRLIIADKNKEELKRLREMLTRSGYDVVGEAEDGISIIKLIHHFEPDLVLMDVEIKGMNGLEVAQMLDEDGSTPVILTTAFYRQDIINKAKESMVMACLIKPLDEITLQATIEITLANFGKFRDLKQDLNKLKGSLESRKTVEIAKGLMMKKLGITEEEAFKRIQKQSMEKRKPMKDIAESIIIAFEM